MATAAPAPTPATGERPRAPDGRFLAADGTPTGEPPPPKETPAQAAQRRKLDLKIRGEAHSLELDDGTAEALARLYGVTPDRLAVALQKDVSGDRAMKESAQREAKVRALIAQLSDPDQVEAALEQLGHDPDALALRRLQARAQREAMTPEERAFAEREQALAAREAKLQAIEQQRQEQERTVAEQQAFESTRAGVLAALQENGLPRSHRTIRMVADVMLGAMQAGLQLTPAQVAAEVRGQLEEASGEYVGALPEEALAARLGPRLQAMPVERLTALLGPRLRDVLQHTVQQQRAKAGVTAAAPVPRQDAAPTGEQEIITPAEAMRRLRASFR